MQTVTFAVDDRELDTLQAALLLLQEQADALPEDIVDIMGAHGHPMTEQEVHELSKRLSGRQESSDGSGRKAPPLETRVETERLPWPLYLER